MLTMVTIGFLVAGSNDPGPLSRTKLPLVAVRVVPDPLAVAEPKVKVPEPVLRNTKVPLSLMVLTPRVPPLVPMPKFVVVSSTNVAPVLMVVRPL